MPAWVCVRGFIIASMGVYWGGGGGGGGVIIACVVYCMHEYTLESTIFIRPNWIKIYGEEYHHEEFVMTPWISGG